MPEKNSLYRSWLPKWAILVFLGIAILPHLLLMTIFNANTSFTASYLDIEQNDIQYLFLLMYGMIVATLLVNKRFFMYFNIKNYLLIMTSISIVLLLLMSITKNVPLLMVLRFFQGGFAMLEGAIFIPLIMKVINNKYAQFITYTFLYFGMNAGAVLSNVVLKPIVENFGHQDIFLVIGYLHIIVLIIVFIIFNNHQRIFPKYPLYQLNLTSVFTLFLATAAGAYVFCYGQKLYWFESPKIVIATITCLLFSALFIFYQYYGNRPVFDYRVLLSKKLWIGMGLFVIFYFSKMSINTVIQFIGSSLKWPWQNVIAIQYWQVYGFFFGGILAVFFLIKKVRFPYIFILGFLTLSVSYFIFKNTFYFDVPVGSFRLPFFLYGTGVSVLMSPLVMYMINYVHPNLSSNAAIMGTTTRYWTLGMSYAILINFNWLHIGEIQQQLQSKFRLDNPLFEGQWNALLNQYLASNTPDKAYQLAAQTFHKRVLNQATILASIDFVSICAYLTLGISILMLIYLGVDKWRINTSN